jgi:uncharacterized membrane protein YkvA (DUF1232 family)
MSMLQAGARDLAVGAMACSARCEFSAGARHARYVSVDMRKQPSPKEEQFKAVVWPVLKRTPAYVRLAWALARDPAIPHRHKTMLYGTVVYQLSPIHYAVTPIPVIGQVDFFILLTLSIKQMLDHCPPKIAEAHFARLGLATDQLDRDSLAIRSFCGKSFGRASRQFGGNVKFAGRVAGGMGRRMLRRVALRIVMEDAFD